MHADPLDRLRAALADRYVIERALGSGGMATVYLARDLKHHRSIAIKVLKSDLAAVLGVERFLQEIEITAGLSHPHIVPLYDSGEADGAVFYVMPWVEGESLREHLRRQKQLPVDEAISIAHDVAGALAYAHGRGVVHRDIKPENILLVDGHALVVDFGIARAVVEAGGERLTETGISLGTPAYMSPEQASGERDLDGRTDVYALGCVLYEALAGEPPYTGATAQAIIARHLTEPVPRVRVVRDHVPEHVESAITRALAKLPADRFATARQFADALVGSSAGTLTRPDALAPFPTPPVGVSRRISIAARIALASVAVLAVLIALDVGGLRHMVERRVGEASSATAVEGRSLAVLPFENVGGNPDEEYFSDGLTDELIATLSQLRSLRVAARTSAFAFKGQARDIREIGRALNVATVLEGSVRKAADRVRVTAQLIDASSGLTIWSETYEERALADIFDIQADVALRIARALEANLTASERGRLARRPTESLEAYTLYLKGRYFWNRRGEALDTAIAYFERAIAADPQYARAHAGLASAYAPLGVHGYIRPDDGRQRMGEAARRAAELDDGLAEAHTVLAAYLHVYEWDWAAAESEYRLAIELDPNEPTAYNWYGFFLEGMRRFDEAIAARERARDLDPLAPSSTSGLGYSFRLAGRYDLAKAGYEDALELYPDYWLAYDALGELAEAMGDLEAAVRAYESAAAHAGRTARARAGLARGLALSGKENEARRLIEELRSEAATSGIYHPTVAMALVAVGDRNAAIEWLEAAWRQRHPDLVRIDVEPRYAELRPDPRFQNLLRRIGFRR